MQALGGQVIKTQTMANVKTLLSSVKSTSIGTCECCEEPVYDPAHQLARTIFAALPLIPGMDAQAIYEEIVIHIEEAFGELLVLADEFDEAEMTVN
jgi:hypothetical protein